MRNSSESTMTRIAIVTGANQDHGFAFAEDLVSGRAVIACAASRAMSGARIPAQAAVAPLRLATDAAADAPLRRVGPRRRGDRVALSIRQVIRA
jgi:NAD(P)-dependent dehydrogenase (short-subunit alcohol dehydrogenase family)